MPRNCMVSWRKKEPNERNIMASPLQLATSFLRRAVEVKACAAENIL
jgi:hypothetical protein